MKELQAFRVMARCSYDRVQGPLKRVKQTSGVGVSPDTTSARPQSKLSRRRLTYCKHAVLKHLSLSLALSYACHTHTQHTHHTLQRTCPRTHSMHISLTARASVAVDSRKDVDSLDHVQAESSVVGRLPYNTSGGRQDSSREYEELSQPTTEK